MDKSLLAKIEIALKDIKLRYEKKYGAVFFDVKVKNLNDIIILEGIVLSERQKNEALLVAQKISEGARIKNKIKILSDPKEKLEIRWGIVKSSIANIWAIFPGKKTPKDSMRATQAVKGDIVRILAVKNNWYLVQTQDLAVGWVKGSQMLKVKSRKSAKKWKNIKRSKANEIMNTGLIDKTRKKFFAFLNNYLYVPYVWGGMTELGIDCSGLTQKFYWEIFGILTPRNSRDQALCGKEIDLSSAKFGDLLFLREKTKKYPHIGIVIDADQKPIRRLADKSLKIEGLLVLNARREKDGVVIQSAEEILKDYNLISVKRLINL